MIQACATRYSRFIFLAGSRIDSNDTAFRSDASSMRRSTMNILNLREAPMSILLFSDAGAPRLSVSVSRKSDRNFFNLPRSLKARSLLYRFREETECVRITVTDNYRRVASTASSFARSSRPASDRRPCRGAAIDSASVRPRCSDGRSSHETFHCKN